MTAEANRQSIITEIKRAKDAWATYSLFVEYPNQTNVDLAQVSQAYLAVDIEYVEGSQLDMGDNPLVADYGSIILAAGAKEGAGTHLQLALLDHFRPYLQLRDNLGAVRTHAGKLQKGVPRLGFYYIPLIIPFWTVAAAPAVP